MPDPLPGVAVLERAASYRSGLEAALVRAGFTIREPHEAAVLVVPLRAAPDCEIVGGIGEEVVKVALIPDLEARSVAHALAHGAAGVAPWDDDPDAIARVAVAAVGGTVLLPREAAAAMASWGPNPHGDGPVVTPDEVEWLLELSRGGTVVRLAEGYGYSERAMFRKLADLYARLGVANRAEALLAASRYGLLAR